MTQHQSRFPGPGLPMDRPGPAMSKLTSAVGEADTRGKSEIKRYGVGHTNHSSVSQMNNSMDESLYQLIWEILEHTDGSSEQKLAIGQLLKLIPDLPGIYKPSNPTIDERDALNRALQGVSMYQKTVSGHPLRLFVEKFQLDIDKDKPTAIRSYFVRRFNRILKNKEVEIYRETEEYLSLDAPISGGDGKTTYGEMLPDETPTGVERIIEEKKRENWQAFQRYLEADPEGKLRKCAARKYPQLNCHELVKRRLLKDPPDQWQDIAKELNVPFGSLGPRWNRNCKPLLQEIAKSFGFTWEDSHE